MAETTQQQEARKLRFDRDGLEAFLSEYVGSGLLADDFKALRPAQRIDTAVKFAPFLMHKLKSVDMSVGLNAEIKKSHLLDDDIDAQIAQDLE